MITIMITPKLIDWAKNRVTSKMLGINQIESKTIHMFKLLSILGEAAFWNCYQDTFASEIDNVEIDIKTKLRTHQNIEDQIFYFQEKEISESKGDFIVLATVAKSFKSVTLIGFESSKNLFNKAIRTSQTNPYLDQLLVQPNMLLPIESLTESQIKGIG